VAKDLAKLVSVCAAAAVLAAGSAQSGATAAPSPAAPEPATRDVLFAGNNNAGTVTLVDAKTFARLGEIDIVPDLAQRIAAMNPIERAAYEVVRGQVGGDKFVDDMAVSPDGRTLYVSRSNLADAAAFDIRTRRQVWRVKVDGHRADHMALSPDGSRLLISALTANKVQAIDTARGVVVDSFATGDYPHENQYSPDGRTVYNASIGIIPIPDATEWLKGMRVITVADANTLRVKNVHKFPHGIRPFLISPDERTIYAQQSFLHGFVEYDLAQQRIVRTVNLPLSEEAKKLKREDYPFDSAHHGLAMSSDGTKLCDAGTVSDYVAIISRDTMSVDRIIPVGDQPYWAATSLDGRYCFVSNSLSDSVSVISYDEAREVTRFPVGHYPQRLRVAAVPEDVLAR
jgi:DNA-binding beta-propeller fold protein YncE